MAEQSVEGIFARAMQLAPLFRASVGRKETEDRTGIPVATVSRYFRVFRSIDAGLTDDQIATKQSNFSARGVASIRSAYADVVQDTGNKRSIEQFLAGHRQRMYGLADQLAGSAKPDIEPWPSGWLAKSWPYPWTGPADGRPFFKPESEPQFAFMLEHLEKFRVKVLLENVHGLARELRRCALKIQRRVQVKARKVLSDDLLKAAILYGSQMVEAQQPEDLEITLTGLQERTSLRINAYMEWFSTRTDAEKASGLFRTVVERVSHAPETSEFFSIRDELKDAIKKLVKTLEIAETVRYEINESTCTACRSAVAATGRKSHPVGI